MRGIFLPKILSFGRRLSLCLLLGLLALIASSCAITGFKESSAVSLELRFYRWDSICMMKPDTRNNGFSPVFNVGEVTQEINQRKVARDLAVVVVGTGYNDTQSAKIAAEWHKRLDAQGFRRVVILRGNDGMKLSGLPIIADFASVTPNDSALPLHTLTASVAAP